MRTETTEDIMKRMEKFTKHSKPFTLPLNEPIQYPSQKLPMDPYVLGLILGDGSFRFTSSNRNFAFSSADEELPSSIAAIMGWTYKRNSEFNYNYYFTDCNNRLVKVEDMLSFEPSLINAYSAEKYIPKQYLIGSIAQRKALLQGLLDTDGSIDKVTGTVSICSVSKHLIEDVRLLCNSLGYTTTLHEDIREKYKTGVCYYIRISTPISEKTTLFRLGRKQEIAQQENDKPRNRREARDHIKIMAITPLSRYEEMTCFVVDNEESLLNE